MYNRYLRDHDGEYAPVRHHQHHGPHRHERQPESGIGGFLSGLFGGSNRQIGGFLKNLKLDSGDILLLLILLYLFIESDDDEIIIALALVLFLGL